MSTHHSHPTKHSQPDPDKTTLDILGIARIPVTLKEGECVRQLKQRLCFAPNVRLLHDGQLLTDGALVPTGTDIMIAPGMVGGGDASSEQGDIASPSMPIGKPKVPQMSMSVPSSAPSSASSSLLAQQTDLQLLGSSVKSTTSTSSSASRNRCHSDGCEDRPAKIVGDCRYCQGRFCTKHRLPEAHQCDNMEHCRQQSLAKNTDKLMSGKCVADKM